MALLDELELSLKAGTGGTGVVRWRQEKFKPLSGPGGGNGGRGGNVYAEAVSDLAYLDTYRHVAEFQAEHGDPGSNFGKQGKQGADLVLKFPVGSLITNRTTREVFELTKIGERILLLQGGRGGLGNEFFKSSRNTSPTESTPGEQGESATFHIELRLFAELGFIGLPSAGKSTLLNLLTRAQSKVAAYHFTTLDPHLGAFYEFTLADIPGLIEGASDGKGLGTKFLKHITRTRVLAHVVSLESETMTQDYQIIRGELERYGRGLPEKEEIIIFSKSDMLEASAREARIEEFFAHSSSRPYFVVSMYDDNEVKALADGLIAYLRK
jgi:GTPase